VYGTGVSFEKEVKRFMTIVSDVADEARALKGNNTKLVIIGYSRGAVLANELACATTLKVAYLGLIDPVAKGTGSGGAVDAIVSGKIPKSVELASEFDAMAENRLIFERHKLTIADKTATVFRRIEIKGDKHPDIGYNDAVFKQIIKDTASLKLFDP
jgi:thioesterase domain-containing protein